MTATIDLRAELGIALARRREPYDDALGIVLARPEPPSGTQFRQTRAGLWVPVGLSLAFVDPPRFVWPWRLEWGDFATGCARWIVYAGPYAP